MDHSSDTLSPWQIGLLTPLVMGAIIAVLGLPIGIIVLGWLDPQGMTELARMMAS